MEQISGGCLCGEVRIVASGRPDRVASATASIAANTTEPSLAPQQSTEDAVAIAGQVNDYQAASSAQMRLLRLLNQRGRSRGSSGYF